MIKIEKTVQQKFDIPPPVEITLIFDETEQHKGTCIPQPHQRETISFGGYVYTIKHHERQRGPEPVPRAVKSSGSISTRIKRPDQTKVVLVRGPRIL